MNKRDILLEAKKARQNELTMYDINAENFRHIIAAGAGSVGDDTIAAATRAWAVEMQSQLDGTLIERAKTQMILDAVEAQLAQCEAAAN